MVLNSVDTFRSFLLKKTLKVSLFRQIYTTRSYRLMFFFMLSLVFNFTLAMNFPLWMLLIGPLVLGIPHLMSSIRYIPQLTSMNRFSIPVVGSVFVLIALTRLWMGTYGNALLEGGPNTLEIIAGFCLLGLVGFFYRQSKIRIAGSLFLLGSLLIASLSYPLETLGFLVLAHNFIAFFFWITRAKSKADKMTACLALLIFSGVSFAILTGAFDFFISERLFEIFNGFNDASIGAQIFPHADMTLWSRTVSAYALGQGIHYFVWLKAIPEQELPYQHTTNFSYSFKLLKSDMGNRIVYFSGWVLIGLVAYALLKNFIEARFIYLSLAAFHGYFEIMALPFVKAKTI